MLWFDYLPTVLALTVTTDSMDVEMGGLDGQRKGFHTFLMTGDAIIRTNFNPFKPTRQLSLDSQPEPARDKPKTERCVSHQEPRLTDSSENNNDDEEEDEPELVSPASRKCMQNKEFIPGFMKVDDQACETVTQTIQSHTEDSGIDVRLSGEIEGEDNESELVTQSTSQKQLQSNGQSQTAVAHQSEELVSVDQSSARRLATRLYQLDGFKLSDVCYYLSKRSVPCRNCLHFWFIFSDFKPVAQSFKSNLRFKQIVFTDPLNLPFISDWNKKV